MERIKEEWEAFRALSFQKKLEHIWLYYKWYFLVAAAVICVGVSLAGTLAENRKETLISGIFINNSTTSSGYTHLSEDYWTYCGGNRDEKVELVTGRSIHFDAESLSQEDAAAFMVVASMVGAQALDYIITDEASLDDFLEQDIVMDLGEFLPEEILAKWDTIRLDGSIVALRLENTAFGRNYPLSAENSCILIISNTKNRENVLRFLDYLLEAP